MTYLLKHATTIPVTDRRHRSVPNIAIQVDDTDEVLKIVSRILKERRIVSRRPLLLQGLCMEALSMIGEGSHAMFDASGRSGTPLVREAINYIDAHLGDPATVQSVADHLFISREYLYKLFLRDLGVTPSAFIARTRLSQAQERLGRETTSLGEIALACGYGTAYAMSKAFSRHTGMSPSRWRKLHRSI
ncbi:helix-turn-helix domain-containing protein [Bifidobacterium biavatii]|uniref:AraC family transcriptional regulator n=1 Tax=Bifidobacterium biavatii DSM 23969 TaxID=1437608 RepID=A0A087A0J3_9BIFI|nr:AraC family transcriptional regulator [Bifidobacterium biavatii]KFI52293.1 AraC family transcriptional regulator [Bifidobacterium biavatii DSM 23969]